MPGSHDLHAQEPQPRLLTNKRHELHWSPDAQDDHKRLVEETLAKTAKRRRNVFGGCKLWSSIFIPVLIFAVCGTCAIVFFHHHMGVITCLCATMLTLFAACVVAAQNIISGKWRTFVQQLSLLCFMATLFGSLIGYYNYIHVVGRFWEYYEHRRYTNVMPDELAAAHVDASAIVFAEGTHPDVTRPVGYKVGHHTYCVAPITVRNVQLVTPDIQYWAVGKDCCRQRSHFTCDDSTDQKAHSGIVYMNASFQLDVKTIQDMHAYRQAVKMAQATYGFTSPPTVLLIRWVKDIEDGLHDIFKKAWYNLLYSSLVYLALSVVVGVAANRNRT